MLYENDVDRLLAMTEKDFAAHLRASYAVSATFFEAMQPTIAAGFRDLPAPQRRIILTTTERAFSRQAAAEAEAASAFCRLERSRALVEEVLAARAGSRRHRKVWVPHVEFAPPGTAAKKAG